MRLVPIYDALTDFLPKLEEELTKIIQKDNPHIDKVEKHHRFYFDDEGKLRRKDISDYSIIDSWKAQKQTFSFWHVYIDLFGENIKNDSIEIFYMTNCDKGWDYIVEQSQQNKSELILIEAMRNLSKSDVFIEAKQMEDFDPEGSYTVHLHWSW